MIYVCYFLLGILLIRLLVVFVNYFSFAYLPKVAPLTNEPEVSILIPARNEEENIGTLLRQLSNLTYSNYEIIVYDDHSSDKTEHILNEWASRNPAIRIIAGTQLPQGWLGKNYACHQLAQAASGTILLFLDSDINVQKDLLRRGIGHLQKYELHLLSIFPKQIVKSIGEKVSVPLMNLILLSLLPLPLVRKVRNKALSGANGQFMMFQAVTYKTLWPHERYKDHKVEDMAIMRLLKEKDLACDTRLGDNDISCRMYVGLDAAIEGFTKNIFQFFGNSVLVTIVFGLITTMAPFIIYYHMGLWWLAAYLLGILSIRFFVSLASQQNVVQNMVLAFPQHLVFLAIIMKGLINNKRKKIIWKGRNILQE